MTLNITIEVKDSRGKYVAEKKFRPVSLLQLQSGKSARNLHMSKG